MSTRGAFTAWGGASDQAPAHGGNVACGEGARYLDTDCLALEDYFRRLDVGANASAAVLGEAVAALAPRGAAPASYAMAEERKRDEDAVLVFNPLGHPRASVIQALLPEHLKVHAGQAPPEVHAGGVSGATVPAQMAEDGMSLHFAALVPAAGSARFTLAAAKTTRSATQWPNVTAAAPTTPIRNAALEVTFGGNGGLASITNLKDSAKVKTAQGYYNYETTMGGPYVLVERAQAVALPPPSAVRTVRGPVFTEVVATFRGWGSASATQPGPTQLAQATRLVDGDADVVEVFHEIPVIPEDRELISRVETDLDSDTLWNDDTGLELYPRPFNLSLPISANYHSLVNSGVLRSKPGSSGRSERQLAVLSRHTMGIASLSPGSLEYMMMRRISGTDNQGPWPLNETTPITVHTALLAGADATVSRTRLRRALEHENPPVVLYGAPSSSESAHAEGGAIAGSAPGLAAALPPGLHLLSLYIRDPKPAPGPAKVGFGLVVVFAVAPCRNFTPDLLADYFGAALP
jgi:hypothetical protein